MQPITITTATTKTKITTVWLLLLVLFSLLSRVTATTPIVSNRGSPTLSSSSTAMQSNDKEDKIEYANNRQRPDKDRTLLLGLMDKLVDFCELISKQLDHIHNDDKSSIIAKLDCCPIGDDDDASELTQYLATTIPMHHHYDSGSEQNNDQEQQRESNKNEKTRECWMDAILWLKKQLLAIRVHLLLESSLFDCLVKLARLARYFEDTCADIVKGSSTLVILQEESGKQFYNFQDSWPMNEITRNLVSFAKLHQKLTEQYSEQLLRDTNKGEEIVKRLILKQLFLF